jgi:hypothetical protein
MILSNICWGDRLDFALNHLAHFLLEGHGGQNAFYAWFYVGIDIGLGMATAAIAPSATAAAISATTSLIVF